MTTISIYTTNEGLKVYIDSTDGSVYTTPKTLAVLCGVSDTAVENRLNKTVNEWGNLEGSKNAEIVTKAGLRWGNLINEKDSVEMIGHYAFEAGRYVTETAQKTFKVFAMAGFRKFAHELANYTKEPKRLTYCQRLDQMDSRLANPTPYTWTVVEMTQDLLRKVDTVYPVNSFDLLDGSIGKCWSKYRKSLGLPETTTRARLKVNQSEFPINIKTYPDSEWQLFRTWLESEYIPCRLNNYLEKKYGVLVKI